MHYYNTKFLFEIELGPEYACFCYAADCLWFSTGALPGRPYILADESLVLRVRRVALLDFPAAVDAELSASFIHHHHHQRRFSSAYTERPMQGSSYTEGHIVSPVDDKAICIASYTGIQFWCSSHKERETDSISILPCAVFSIRWDLQMRWSFLWDT